MKFTKATISPGNIKLGKIPNVSLIPGLDCRFHELCFEKCYARKAMYRPNVSHAWSVNSDLANSFINYWFKQIGWYLEKHKPPYFRWHVGGDIITQEYYDYMVKLALQFPETRFLCFTKRVDLDYSQRPDNLRVWFSRWPGDTEPQGWPGIGYAWLQDGTETRIPENAVHCPGKCDQCFKCWHMKKDVVFTEH